MPAITVDIPDDLAANFDTPEAIRQALFEDFVIEQRQRGAISLGKAAELLGISYPEVFELLSSKGLSPINTSPQDLDESYRRLVELMDKGSRAGLGAARQSAADGRQEGEERGRRPGVSVRVYY